MKSVIPVVLTSDKSYAIPLYVTVVSSLLNKRSDTVYQFHMLISGDFSKNIINSVDELLVKYGCPKANWIDMKKQYKNVDMNLKHISYATYYRLQIPNILDEDKCIYLDVDVCVKSDLSEYFNIDVENYYMAGVKAAGYYVPEDKLKNKAEKLKIAEFDRYVNAGVLLLNLKKLRESNMAEKFQKCMDYNFSDQDQDILNSALYPNIKTLAPKYNVMTKYPMTIDGYDTSDALKACFTKEEWTEAITNPVVIHYADVKKPWMYTESSFANMWWNAFDIATNNIQDKALWSEDLLVFYKLTQDRHIINEDKYLHSVNLRNSKIEKLNEINKALDTNINSLRKDVSNLKSDNTNLNCQIIKQKNENELTTNKLKKLSEQMDSSKIENQKLLSKNEILAEEKRTLESENKKLIKKINKIESSSSYKFGRGITYLPRKINGFLKSITKKSVKLVVFDVAIDSDNLGDEIIMKYSIDILNKIFPNNKAIHIPTHRPPTYQELRRMKKADYKIICGTNIINEDVSKYSLMKYPEDLSEYKDIILMGVGWNNYSGAMQDSSRNLYKKIFSSNALLSLRDQYTTDKMKEFGFDNVVNTNCLTLWKMTKKKCQQVKTTKSNNVVFTLTSHRPNQERDQYLIDTLVKNYDKVYFWAQGDKDLDYLKKFNVPESVIILDRTLKAYEELLKTINLDYVGTRLHGGIHALNSNHRILVIGVDNRATEIASDTNLPVIPSEDVFNLLESKINSNYKTNLHLNWEEIEKWKGQFKS